MYLDSKILLFGREERASYNKSLWRWQMNNFNNELIWYENNWNIKSQTILVRISCTTLLSTPVAVVLDWKLSNEKLLPIRTDLPPAPMSWPRAPYSEASDPRLSISRANLWLFIRVYQLIPFPSPLKFLFVFTQKDQYQSCQTSFIILRHL